MSDLPVPDVDIGNDGAIESSQGTGLGYYRLGRDPLGGKNTIPRGSRVPVIDNRNQTFLSSDNQDQGVAIIPE